MLTMWWDRSTGEGNNIITHINNATGFSNALSLSDSIKKIGGEKQLRENQFLHLYLVSTSLWEKEYINTVITVKSHSA